MDQDDRKAADEVARADDDSQDIEVCGQGDEGGSGEPATFELELDGQVHTLPAALKGAFLRQADYTRKTQELAEHRRALEAERRALADRRASRDAALSGHAHLAALDDHLKTFAGVDWRGLAEHDPARAQALWNRFEETQALRDQYASALAHHEAREHMHAAHHAANEMARTGQVLAREVEGWSPELAGKLVAYAQSHGVDLDELAQASDPRIWKILHRAYRADAASDAGARQETAGRALAVRPAVTVAGAAAGGGGVRDELAAKEWMHRRNEQVRRAR